ncbi:serine/threonine-protein phosphatase 1 regulatory subunit 10 [Odontomachus brunneus]|uniref:serine/threonine-protein phosphatase 1 regulatory subunit 10 n=1 Tax=Odontomachus brunneus TaxID=486640 RepID=UPI0013F1B8ED|nr:serine/threonine-protein phosphatase 1 regulatory subunit 10 [Odontomachus brunneus]XP_032677520.1 serine/threonine-protein phosphatase 1 regulatory subunit 10 [Odontomachus brunneus]XP_032677521.1 serine/threonine-protein phosphatase 1 regulatory subunit 10 [Odontomachus brunneus]
MPRIDPLSLLRCLSVLLGPTGGIKSKEEVHRLANLMTKFSKKLVSKCIYIQILKTTNTDLLSQFMTAGGWNLIHTWLTDGILAKNWALIQELLELMLLCPVDIERLKSNNSPKLIKGLSKEGSHQGVRVLASRLVEQWLKIVKGEAAPNSVPAQIMTVPVQTSTAGGQNTVALSSQQQQHYSGTQQNADAIESATVHVQDLKLAQQFTGNTTTSQSQQDQEHHQQERLQSQTVQLQVVGKAQQAQIQQQPTQQSKKQSFVVVSSQSSVPVYKITIRDGNQVLAKVETDPANINSVLNTSGTTGIEVNGNVSDVTGLSVKQEVKKAESEELEEKTRQSDSASTTSGQDDAVETRQSHNSEHVPSEVKQTVVSSKDNHDVDSVKDKDNKDSKDIVNSDSSKSSDKENRDSHKKDEKKPNSSSDKKSSSHHHGSSSSSSKSSKHSSSSGAHRTSSHKSGSHRSGSSSSSSKSSGSSKDRSSKDKDKHHSSSSSKHSSSRSKSERDKEREKEKQKKDQAEKDKATLEKVQGQALSSKLGKIPKKRSEDEKSNDTNGRKSSTDSRDSSKENKEKTTDSSKKVATLPEKKNISISIESRKNNQDSITRPKTVKTFNSKFRSTGLEEEVKPPPPRSKKPNSVVDKKVIPQKISILKRSSPLRDTVPLVEKRAKLSLDSPTSPADEKKGGIKLIPPKPKPMMLQESDMFMDALTASTKGKEQRKRKRRISITKDGSSEAKKQETLTVENRESTPPPASPSNPEDKSPVTVKPNFKFYQDTLEIEDDKEQKENSEEDLKKDKDLAMDDDKDNRDDDDGSNTPTPEEDVEDAKDSESPEDASSIVSDSSKKDNVNSYSEIRYVDGLRSVLLLQKRKGPKKILKWKTDLESIRYFELDETERVNVTKTFTDMKQMEKQNEREAFQMARKLNNEDLMEERTRWKPLIPIDLPPPLVEPGKDSREKDIQYAREKGILQALYFNRSMIPDSAAEPDEERHHVVTDPKVIPLDDLTGNKESEKDFTSVPWPEPKPQLIPQPPAVTTFHYPTFPHNQQPMMTPMGPQQAMGPMSQMPQQMMTPTHMGPMSQEMTGPMSAGGGGWRTGDGKVVVPDVSMNPMANMSGGFNQGMEGGPMVPPGMMGPPPMYNQQQEGYGMMGPEDMGGFNNMNPNNFQGPPGPMYPPGPNFPGPRGVPIHSRGRAWYRGGGPGRGGWRGGGGGWRGSGKQPPVCRQFSKNGYCRVGDKCQYLHPGVNCPPF